MCARFGPKNPAMDRNITGETPARCLRHNLTILRAFVVGVLEDSYNVKHAEIDEIFQTA